MSSVYLRPCPFCGGKPYLTWNYSHDSYYVRAKCGVCEAQGKTYKGEDNPTQNEWNTSECKQAASAWNLRSYDRINLEDIDVTALSKALGMAEK